MTFNRAQILADCKKWAETKQPNQIYRCYDAAGRLVYIGCAAVPEDRMRNHMCNRERTASVLLRHFMATFEVDGDFYRGQIAGRHAEKVAIRAEQPLFNLQHTGRPVWLRNRVIADYIREQTGRSIERRHDSDGFETTYRVDGAYLSDFLSQTKAA